jgi:hypothetical protein
MRKKLIRLKNLNGLEAYKIIDPQQARIKKQNEIDLKKYKPANEQR